MAMKERPIIFSGPMVRAIRADLKTQTRRIVKPAPDRDFGRRCVVQPHELAGEINAGRLRNSAYGVPGDRLWVRETFAGSIAYERQGYPLKEWGNKIWYLADGEPRSGQWTQPRPSIHMPRCLSRITLEIVSVRIERLHVITNADALAEGVDVHPNHHGKPPTSIYSAVQAYRDLWESIHGPGSWDANPWVWVIGFRKVEA